eukprot:CAMPEP_0117424436 /NCGR_PEP_ID=MMETSP0758-20121206/4855_1 /TAXON_ID=63605 /ORGANISM="Percolomonas cosmopolitus, Strain AE-1 (ATCC 50343)" /LENGTH=307 /DNA_ID=CAMNT_0005208213 /DNA_START=133 /DNA_END=1056 /DNA_ORIENTATION=-
MWNTPYVDLKKDDLSQMDGDYIKLKGELNATQLLKSPVTGQMAIGYIYEVKQKFSVLAKTITKKIKGSNKVKSSWLSSTPSTEQKGSVSTGTRSDKWKVEWETVENIEQFAPTVFVQELSPPHFSNTPEAPQLYPIQLPIESIEKAKYLEQKVVYNQFTPDTQRHADMGSTKKLMGSQTIEKIVQPREIVTIFGQVHVTEDGHVTIGPSRDSFSFSRRISRRGSEYKFFNVGMRSKEERIKKPFIVSQRSEDSIYDEEYKKSLFYKYSAIGTGLLAAGAFTYIAFLFSNMDERPSYFTERTVTFHFQ